MAEQGIEMVRYADDFVILCRTAEDAERALEVVRQWVASNGLTLHPTKTRIVDSRRESFDFLGYTFQETNHWPREKSLAKLKATIRAKTPRQSGESLKQIVVKLNRTLRGWSNYFQHSKPAYAFERLDRWIRMRLRSILRKRIGLKGRGRGADHQRWQNSFFVKQGLFSLKQAHALAVPSSRRLDHRLESRMR